MVAVLCDNKERRNTAYDGLHASSSSFWKPLYAKYTHPRAEKDSAGFVDSKGKGETVRHSQSKEASILWSHHEETRDGSCLEKEITQGTMPGARRRGRPRTAWMDNIKTWTGHSVEESIRMTENRDKWRKYVHGVATGQPSDRGRTPKEQNRTPPTPRDAAKSESCGVN